MARTSATISVGADTRQLERDIQSALARDFKFKGLNEKAFTQPLGRITGASNEFQKSLDASNARVIAFGASAGLIYTVEKAFSSLVRSTIDVQKSLTDINVILNVSSKSLATFGSGLFSIAKDTSQSFNTAAQAATEFSRQGLGLEETLKRTRDALILTRLSGLDTVASVEALTATINSFSDAALDSTAIINKLANVDAAFAVSSADLAEAVKRVGSSAQDAGVDFDELLGIVTSVQQTTARGGAVIGNSLKTIFTRIQRTDTLDQLERLGIQVRTLEGNTLPAIQVLNNLATTFNQLSDGQRAQVAETVGGVFQINILKAALSDLGKEYSVYNRALQTSAGATDQAITRNQALNETLSALINRTFVNLTQLGADFGKISLQPTFQSGLELLNKGLESISSDSQGIGTKIAKGIFEGIGTFVSGPGIILVTAVFGKLFLNLAKFAGESLKALLNLNTQSEQRAQIQAKISQVLSQEPALVQAIFNKQISVLDVENKILNIIRQQTMERQKAASIAATVTGGLMGRGVTAKGGVLKAKSGGFIPNFAMSEMFGALAGGYNPGSIKRMNIPGEGPVTYNSAETVKQFPGMSQPAIMPPQGSKAGKNYQSQFDSVYGFNPYASAGFIPNFNATFTSLLAGVQARKQGIDSSILKAQREGKLTQTQVDQLNAAKTTVRGSIAPSLLSKQGSGAETREIDGSTLGVLSLRGRSGDLPTSTKLAQLPMFSNAIKNDPSVAEKKVRFNNVQVRSLDSLDKQKPNEFIRLLTEKLLPPLADVATQFVGGALGNQGDGVNTVLGNIKAGKSFLPPGAIGDLFETVIKIATKNPKQFLQSVDDDFRRPFDFEESGAASGKFKTRFGFKSSLIKADAKLTSDNDAIRSIIKKAYNSRIDGLPFTELLNTGAQKTSSAKRKSKGFIPNFSALNDALDREITAGVSPSKVRIGKDKRLTSASNPIGLGVYNTKDEPLGLGQGVSRAGNGAKTAGAASGFIPNFVNMPSTFMGDPNALQYQIGVLTETQNKSTKQLVKDFRELSRETKNASQGFQKFGGAALAFSFGLPIILQTLSQFSSNEDIKTQAAINGISTAVSMIGTGAFVGAGMGARGGIYGAAAGAVAGGGIATYQFINALKTEDLQKLQKNLQFLQDEFQSSQSSLQKVIPLIEEYKRVQASAVDEQTKAFNLEKIVNEISTGLGPLGEETVNKVLEAFKNADYDTIGLIINKKLAESSAQLSNEGVKILLEEFKTKGKTIEDSTTAKVIGKSLLSLQTSTGESVIRKLAQTEEGRQRIGAVSKSLEKLLEERSRLEAERIQMERNPIPTISRKNVFGPGGGSELPSFSEGMANFDDGLTPPQMLKEKVKSLNTNLNDILSTIEPLYKDAEETRVKFAEWKIASGSTALNQESSSTLIEQIVKDLRSQGIITEKINEMLKVTAIASIEDYVQAFRNNTLTLRKADEFVKNTLFKKLQDPMEILGKEQGALIQNIGTDILTPYRRDRVYDEIDKATEKLRSQLDDEIIRRKKLDAQLVNKEITEDQYQKEIEKTIITEDQYRKRLEALREKILLDQRKAGGIFAEDFRGGRQETREARILGQQTQLEDFGAAFFDEFDNRTEDSYRQVQLGAADTARTVKSEFNNAFLSFANGTQTASDAFTKMALNISDRIQQLALDFSTNLVFGSLFGSTSNIFGGGGGGGIGDFFSSLFKSKGGMIKGYSTGGNVVGGSGNKDDVPAMLSGGEYVIRKSAVNKYGQEYLQMLNEGKVQKRFFGGAAIAGAVLAQSAKTNPAAASMVQGIAPAFGIQPKTPYGGAALNKNKSMNLSTSGSWGTSTKSTEDNHFKYGGRVQKFADGGIVGNLSKAIMPFVKSTVLQYGVPVLQSMNTKNTATSPSPTYGIGMGRMKNDRQDNHFKYGGRVQRFASGGEAQFLGENVYRYNDPLYPTAGKNVVDKNLNLKALLDQDNPQNRIRQNREMALYDYLNYVEDIRIQNEEGLKENQRLNKEIRDQYNKQKKDKERGALYSAGLGLLGAAAGQFASSGGLKSVFGGGAPLGSTEVRRATAVNDVNLRSASGSTTYTPTQPTPYSGGRLKVGKASGGYIQGFADGGSSGKDDIPALLMGGEFVMKKDAVNMYGKKFFDDLNSGRVRKFANGGEIGSSSETSGSSYSPTNNVSVTVNLNESQRPSESKTSDQVVQSRQDENEKNKILAEQIKNQVISVITAQQRPGGMLSSSVYKKR